MTRPRKPRDQKAAAHKAWRTMRDRARCEAIARALPALGEAPPPDDGFPDEASWNAAQALLLEVLARHGWGLDDRGQLFKLAR